MTQIREERIWAASGDWMVIGPDVAISVPESCIKSVVYWYKGCNSAANHWMAQKSTTCPSLSKDYWMNQTKTRPDQILPLIQKNK